MEKISTEKQRMQFMLRTSYAVFSCRFNNKFAGRKKIKKKSQENQDQKRDTMEWMTFQCNKTKGKISPVF